MKRIGRLSESTLDFRFETEDRREIVYEPGQFFRFTFTDDDGEFERSYSLCNFGDDVEGPYLDVVISRVEGGRATRYLFEAKEGIRASVTGPYGRLLIPEPLPQRLFMVATSVGIAPFLPMLTRLEGALDEGLEVYFLFGARDRSEFLYESRFVDYASRHPGFHLRMCYSRTFPTNSRPFEFKGHVQEQLAGMALDPSSDRFLLCGNPMMIDDVYRLLKARGFGPRQVTREKYVFARETGATPKKQMTEAQKKLLAEKMAKYPGKA